MRTLFLALALLSTACMPQVADVAHAGGASQPTAGGTLNVDGRGVAVHGYDVVAYFEGGQPAKGSAEHVVQHEGATFRFATAEHATAFRKDPARYVPQFGGYCAWAVSQGYTADADPEVWAVVDGKLYLNYNRKIGERWSADKEALIAKAQANWPAVIR